MENYLQLIEQQQVADFFWCCSSLQLDVMQLSLKEKNMSARVVPQAFYFLI